MAIVFYIKVLLIAIVSGPAAYEPHSWYPPLSYETTPAYLQVASGEAHQITSKVKDKDEYLNENEEVVVLCNSATDVIAVITSGSISSITNSFDADTCWRTKVWFITAHTLPPDTWEEYINSFTPVDTGHIPKVKDANGATSTVTVRVTGPPGNPVDPPGGGG